MKMKKTIVLALAAGLGSMGAVPGLAADLPVKAPPPAAVVASGWTGFYIGGNLGYGFGQNSITSSVTAGPASIVVGEGTPLYGGPRNLDLSPRGINGGVQVGYNWQLNPVWVAGLEADFQGADMKRSASCVLACNTPTAITGDFISAFFPVTFSENSISTKLDWFGTVRGRFGYTTGPALFYVTGGFAYADVERSSSVSATTNFLFGGQVNTFGGSYSKKSVLSGWTVGTGVEARLWGGWSAKVEYLYMDLGDVTDTFNTVFLSDNGTSQTGQVAGHRTIITEVKESIARVGLNYRFGGGPY